MTMMFPFKLPTLGEDHQKDGSRIRGLSKHGDRCNVPCSDPATWDPGTQMILSCLKQMEVEVPSTIGPSPGMDPPSRNDVTVQKSGFALIRPATPWKINMEPTNHPFRKENNLPNLHDYGPCQSSRV